MLVPVRPSFPQRHTLINANILTSAVFLYNHLPKPDLKIVQVCSYMSD